MCPPNYKTQPLFLNFHLQLGLGSREVPLLRYNWEIDLLPDPYQHDRWNRHWENGGRSQESLLRWLLLRWRQCLNVQYTVAKIAPDGKVTVVSVSLKSTLVAGATATEFVSTAVDCSVLYASGGIGDLHTINTQVKLPCGCHSRILDRLGVLSRPNVQRKHRPAPRIINKTKPFDLSSPVIPFRNVTSGISATFEAFGRGWTLPCGILLLPMSIFHIEKLPLTAANVVKEKLPAMT